jgi:hypothetical protein
MCYDWIAVGTILFYMACACDAPDAGSGLGAARLATLPTRRRCPKSSTLEFAGRLDTSRSQYSFHKRTGPSRRLGLGMFAVSASMSQVLPWPPMCMSPSCKPFLCTSFCFLHVMCHSTAWVHHRRGNGNLCPSFHFHAISTASLVTSCVPIAAFAEMLLFLGGVAPAAAGRAQMSQRRPATKGWRHCAYKKEAACVCRRGSVFPLT